MMADATCRVCDGPMELFDTAKMLDRYPSDFSRCTRCGMVAVLDTPWLEEAYASAIHTADTGLLRRAQRCARMTSAVLRFEGLRGGRFLDWAGGYGVFTQMMRDRGYDYWQHDDFATPLFAQAFRDDGVSTYDLITAYEVMEHVADPRAELAAVSQRTDLFLFTTYVLPEPAPRVADWWYYMPEVGQHITFHTVESLRILGRELGFELTSNEAGWHLFHRRPLDIRTKLLLSPHAIRYGRQVRAALQR